MSRKLFATAILVLFFGVGLLGSSSKARDQTTTQRSLKVVTAIGEDFKGSSKIVYFSESEDGTRVALAEGEVPAEGNLNIMTAQGVQPATSVRKLAVILTNFTDDTRQPFTAAEVQEAIFGTGPDSLVNRFTRNSYGQVTLVGQVFGWVTVTPSVYANAPCDRGFMANQAARQAAGAIGFDHYMLVVPTQPGCNFGGFADLGGPGSTLYGTFYTHVAFHELGHNLGLTHSRYINYSGSQEIGTSSCFSPDTCEYGDVFDVMGSGEDFHSFNRVKLGWIPDTDVVTVEILNQDQTITLSAREQNIGTRDIAIPLNDVTGYSYHVEYRCCDSAVTGVFVRLGRQYLNDGNFYSYLVPGQRNTTDPYAAALKQGQAYVDETHQVRIEVLSINNSQAQVQVIPIPHIDDVALGKKTTVWGSKFGSDARLIINGVDITDKVGWKKKKPTLLQTQKSDLEALNLKPGQQNTIQVKNGSQSSNLMTVPF